MTSIVRQQGNKTQSHNFQIDRVLGLIYQVGEGAKLIPHPLLITTRTPPFSNKKKFISLEFTTQLMNLFYEKEKGGV